METTAMPTEVTTAQQKPATSVRGSLFSRILHGSWLGHPLHPAMIELPIGAFTTATLLDLGDPKKYGKTADAAVGIGLISAALAATVGLADWRHTDPPARRTGIFHALSNSGATLCYLASWLLRKKEARVAAKGTGFAGWLLLMTGAYIGGKLVYKYRIGVDHAQRGGSDDFVAVFDEAALHENQPQLVVVNGVRAVLIKQQGHVFALGERCAHLGGPLAEGKVGNGSVQCPWHGSTYALEDGHVLKGPSAHGQPCFDVRIRNGNVEIRKALKTPY